jgi:hypothetical protein
MKEEGELLGGGGSLGEERQERETREGDGAKILSIIKQEA